MLTQSPETTYDTAQYLVDNPHQTFVPTGKQLDFLKLDNGVQIFSGGNWTGKTTTMILKLTALAWGTENQLLNFPIPKDFPRKFKFRIVCPKELIETDVVPVMEKWFPKGRYKTYKGDRSFKSRWVFDTGTIGDIMTYDQDPQQFEGVKLHVAIFNEPPPRQIFAATVARMHENGIIMIGMTPLTQIGWLFDRITDPTHKTTWGITYVDVEDSCINHGERGYLTHASIEKKIEEYDPDEKEARISGKPLHLAGLIYKMWDRNIHCIKDETPPEDWTRYCVVDPHDRKPFAISWIAVSPTNQAVVYDEFPNEPFHKIKSSSLTVDDYAKIIKEKEKESGTAQYRVIDARFGNKANSSTGTTIRDLFDKHQLFFSNSYTEDRASIDTGHQEVKEWLKPGPDNQPRLKVQQHCTNHIWAFEHYTWDEFKREEMGLKEKPREVGKDFMDTVRYWAKEDPRYLAPVTNINNQIPKWTHQEEALGYGA